MVKNTEIYGATVENSRNGLMVVNFGTPNAAPCRITPDRLKRPATDFCWLTLIPMRKRHCRDNVMFGASPLPDTEDLHKVVQGAPGALDQRFQLAVKVLLSDNDEAALDGIFKIHQQGPEFSQAHAKRGM